MTRRMHACSAITGRCVQSACWAFVDLGEAHIILRIAYGVMRVENQAAGVADGGAVDSWTDYRRPPRR